MKRLDISSRFSCLKLIAALLLSVLAGISSTEESPSEQNLHRLHGEINAFYDSKHPHLNISASQLKSHHFHKRCTLLEPESFIPSYLSGAFADITKENNVLVTSPCLGSDSLGNFLSAYFESIICARLSGAHFVSVAKVYEPFAKHEPSAFIARLPDVIVHRSPRTVEESKPLIARHCTCSTNCHERSDTAWVKGIDVIKPMLIDALQYHIQSTGKNTTTVTPKEFSSDSRQASWPLIPEVAIHYRCGDNFVGSYGFLPFSAFKHRIPKTAKTVYVLAEKRERKTANNPQHAVKCDMILASLGDYLVEHFPSAKVLVKRGDDLYIDMARLAFAQITFCSVSTFCLWPAVASNGTVYYPKTQLIAAGDTTLDLGSGFKWLSDPKIVLGVEHHRGTAQQLVTRLGGRYRLLHNLKT